MWHLLNILNLVIYMKYLLKKLDLKFKMSAIDLDSYRSIIALINDLLREKDNKERLIEYWGLDSNEFIKETILTKADSVSALIFEYKIFKKLNDGTEKFIRTANITICYISILVIAHKQRDLVLK